MDIQKVQEDPQVVDSPWPEECQVEPHPSSQMVEKSIVVKSSSRQQGILELLSILLEVLELVFFAATLLLAYRMEKVLSLPPLATLISWYVGH